MPHSEPGGTVSVTENQRHQIFQYFIEVMGEERAAIMMDLLPPVGWGDIVTRADLHGELALLRGEMAELRAGLSGEMAALRAGVPGVRTVLRTSCCCRCGAVSSGVSRAMPQWTRLLTREMIGLIGGMMRVRV